jgi:prepilin-type processing-associated H-X9-DG protein
MIEGANPDPFFAMGVRYAGGWGSTVQPLNKKSKLPSLLNRNTATDSYYKYSDGVSLFDTRPSWQGGPHWVSNYRSLHPNGANFLHCDGHVAFVANSIEMRVYRARSTIMGDETLADID